MPERHRFALSAGPLWAGVALLAAAFAAGGLLAPGAQPARAAAPVQARSAAAGTPTPPPAATPVPTTRAPNLPSPPTATPRAGCVLYPSRDVPRAIPDNNPAGVDSTLLVPGPGFLLNNIGVRLDNLQHTYDADLIITLTAPYAAPITLINRLPLANQINFSNTVLEDDAAVWIYNGVAPYTGAYRPDHPLAALNGLNAAGVWRLKVSDVSAGDTGTLNAWGLELCAATGTPPPPPPAPVSTQVTAGSGGSLQLTDVLTAGVTFAPGVTVWPFTATLGLTSTHTLPSGLGAPGPAFFLDEHDTGGTVIIVQPAYTVTLRYAGVSLAGLSASTLALYVWDPNQQAYQLAPGSLDPVQHTLTTQLHQPGEFILAAVANRLFLPLVARP